MIVTLTLRLCLLAGAISAENKDWVETVSFGNVQELFKLDTGAQCNVLPAAAHDKVTKNLCNPRQQS